MNSPLTAPSVNFETHIYLLIKSLPQKMNIKKLKGIFSEYSSYDSIITIPNSRNIYIKFLNNSDIDKILLKNKSRKKPLLMMTVNKLPLDLNKKSKIVLITLYNEKIKIGVFSIYNLFKEYGKIQKIVIFKKKNYQIFI